MATKKQIAALKYLIFRSKDGANITKRLLAFLINHSMGLTRGVYVNLVGSLNGFSARTIQQAAFGLHDMQSCNGTTHIGQVLIAMGSPLVFGYRNVSGTQPGLKRNQCAWTFWLAQDRTVLDAEFIEVHSSELEQIDLSKPGLYPALESQ